MTHIDHDLTRRARQVTVDAYAIECALMHRPGAVPPGEHRTPLDTLNDIARTCPEVHHACTERQIEIAEWFLALWSELLAVAADATWIDPDDQEGDC